MILLNIQGDDSVIWKKFAFKFESATFYDANENKLLDFKGDELRRNHFNSFEENEELTVEEFIKKGMRDVITNDFIALSKMNLQNIMKEYRCSVEDTVVIEGVECKKINFKIHFKFYNN